MKRKRLVPSHLHELHESNFSFVSRIKFIRSKLSNFSASVSRVTVSLFPAAELTETKPPPAAQSFTADSLSQNTLWLRDELFSKNVYATAERDHKDDRHVYVNGLSDPTGRRAYGRPVRQRAGGGLISRLGGRLRVASAGPAP